MSSYLKKAWHWNCGVLLGLGLSFIWNICFPYFSQAGIPLSASSRPVASLDALRGLHLLHFSLTSAFSGRPIILIFIMTLTKHLAVKEGRIHLGPQLGGIQSITEEIGAMGWAALRQVVRGRVRLLLTCWDISCLPCKGSSYSLRLGYENHCSPYPREPLPPARLCLLKVLQQYG